MRSPLIAALCALASLLSPAVASAGTTPVPIIPPGNPGANQYLENVPTATGTGSGQAVVERKPGGQPASNPVPAATRRALAASGAGGAAVTALVAATAPSSAAAGSSTAAGAAAAGTSGAAGSARAAGGSGASSQTSYLGSAAGGSSGHRVGTRAHGTAGAGSSAASAPVTSVLRAAIGSTGSGVAIWLPVALAACAIGVAVLALRRRRAG